MSLLVHISTRDSSHLQEIEVVMQMVKEIKSMDSKNILDYSKITDSIQIEKLYDFLTNRGLIESEFLTYVKEEYGEPWVRGYPIDAENLIKALSEWNGSSKAIIADYMNYTIAYYATYNSYTRGEIYNLYKAKLERDSLYINPIDKKYRNFSFKKGVSLEEISSGTGENSILDNIETILALTDDELIKTQVEAIRDKVNKKEG